jgi:hypothetical protein
VHGDFDDHIDVVGNVFSNRHGLQTHVDSNNVW